MISVLADIEDLIGAWTVVCFLLPGDSAGNSFALVKKQLTAFVAHWYFSPNQKIKYNVKVKDDTELPKKPALRW